MFSDPGRPLAPAFAPASIVESSFPHLSEAIVSPEARATAHAIAAPLPWCASSVGFECRLAADSRIDLGMSVTPQNGGASVLGGRTGDRALDRLTGADQRWSNLSRVASEWVEDGSLQAARIPFIFLEFDADSARMAVPVPSVFLGLDWPVEELAGSNGGILPLGLQVTLATAEKLRSSPFPRETLERAARCFSALPRGGLLLHAGLMLGRAGESLRYSVLLPRFRAADFLSNIGLGFEARTVGDAIKRYGDLGGFAEATDPVQLDFDVTGDDDRVGLALCPKAPTGWDTLLKRLEGDGLCTRDKREGLLLWPGSSIKMLGTSAPPCVLVRMLEHAKLVCRGPAVIGAKAYFGATPMWPGLNRSRGRTPEPIVPG